MPSTTQGEVKSAILPFDPQSILKYERETWSYARYQARNKNARRATRRLSAAREEKRKLFKEFEERSAETAEFFKKFKHAGSSKEAKHAAEDYLDNLHELAERLVGCEHELSRALEMDKKNAELRAADSPYKLERREKLCVLESDATKLSFEHLPSISETDIPPNAETASEASRRLAASECGSSIGGFQTAGACAGCGLVMLLVLCFLYWYAFVSKRFRRSRRRRFILPLYENDPMRTPEELQYELRD